MFTKETARGKFRQFLKLIMLLFAVQFFLPVLLEPMFIFSIYSGDNDDNFHLHIAFHLEVSLSLSLSHTHTHTHIHTQDITVCHFLHGNRKCKLHHHNHWSVRRREAPKQILKERRLKERQDGQKETQHIAVFTEKRDLPREAECFLVTTPAPL